MSNEIYNRRNFLKKSARAVAMGAVGTLALKNIDLSAVLPAENLQQSESKITKVINLSDYPALQSVGGHAMISGNVILIRSSKSKFTALSTVCTHKKCDLDYTGSGFECPCHGSTFNKSGKVLTGPAKKNLRSYSTSYNEAAGTVTVNM
jgi:Rieske Fe-S protein